MVGWTHTWKKDGFNFSSVSVFHRSTKGRKGEEHICLVFKTICTYNLAFKHVHGSLIRLFVSFDKNTPNCPEQDIFVCGEYVVVCVCAFQTEAPTANVVVYKTTCTRVSSPIALLFPTIGVLTDTPLYVHTHTQPKITAGRVVLNLLSSSSVPRRPWVGAIVSRPCLPFAIILRQ